MHIHRRIKMKKCPWYDNIPGTLHAWLLNTLFLFFFWISDRLPDAISIFKPFIICCTIQGDVIHMRSIFTNTMRWNTTEANLLYNRVVYNYKANGYHYVMKHICNTPIYAFLSVEKSTYFEYHIKVNFISILWVYLMCVYHLNNFVNKSIIDLHFQWGRHLACIWYVIY